MAVIADSAVTIHGGAPTFRAAAAGDTAVWGAGREAEFRNSSGSSVTVTVACHGTTATGDVLPDKPYTLAATTGEQRIPLNLAEFKDPNDGQVHFSYSAITGVTCAVSRR
jgi:cytochrome c553